MALRASSPNPRRGRSRRHLRGVAAVDRYSIPELIALARRFDPGLTDEDFTDAGHASIPSATAVSCTSA
jgi:hypothetical protein